MENTGLFLYPYEVLSLGPSAGIIEMVKDAITIDNLKQKLSKSFKDIISLNQFFQFYYGENVDKAKLNFCKSLAGYSIICYLLQVKDRHNGNILLHKDGYMIHIDFGYYLCNMPGLIFFF